MCAKSKKHVTINEDSKHTKRGGGKVMMEDGILKYSEYQITHRNPSGLVYEWMDFRTSISNVTVCVYYMKFYIQTETATIE